MQISLATDGKNPIVGKQNICIENEIENSPIMIIFVPIFHSENSLSQLTNVFRGKMLARLFNLLNFLPAKIFLVIISCKTR
jgi:hypothetical protein